MRDYGLGLRALGLLTFLQTYPAASDMWRALHRGQAIDAGAPAVRAAIRELVRSEGAAAVDEVLKELQAARVLTHVEMAGLAGMEGG
ncbi:hypothetical protein ACIBBG_34210 [Micromonospora chersina]|uniref:hypothetical protein n=1 Tax=Micromonospora chersina TaxID=47854 RepID=UPI00379B30F5